MKPILSESKETLKRCKKSVDLLCVVVLLFSLSDGTVLDLYVETFTLAIRGLGNRGSCTSVEKNRLCYVISLTRMTSLS